MPASEPPKSPPPADVTAPVALLDDLPEEVTVTASALGAALAAATAAPPPPAALMKTLTDQPAPVIPPAPPPPAPPPVRTAPAPTGGVSIDAAGHIGAIDELLEIAQAEAAAQPAPAARDDLRVRAAFLAWDARGDALLAARLVEGIDHPAAEGLLFDLALDAGEPARLDALTARARERDDQARLHTLGVAWLHRGDATRAIEALSLAGPPAREDLALALGAAAKWAELASLRAGEPGIEGPLEAAWIAGDRMADPAAAREHLARAAAAAKAAAPEAGPDPLDDPYLVERMLELDLDAPDVLRRKIDALAAEPSALAERSAAQYLLATKLPPGLESASVLAALCAGDGDFGLPLSLLARASVEAALGDAPEAAGAWLQRAEKIGVPAWAAALRRRAAEILEARSNDVAQAEALQAGLAAAEPGSIAAHRALLRLRLHRGDLAGFGAALSAWGRARRDEEGRLALVGAARALEARHRGAHGHVIAVPGRIGEPAPPPSDGAAAEMVERWLEAVGGRGDREALEALARAFRRAGDRAELVATYRRLAASAEPRAAAALLTVAGALALHLGLHDDAAVLLGEAAAAAPADPVRAVAQAHVARALGRHQEEADALARAADGCAAPASRARLLGRIAEVRREHLGDITGAADALKKALALHPEDAATLRACARLAGEEGRWQEAVEYTERAAEAAAPAARAAFLLEAGTLYEQRLADDTRAAGAYRRALEADPADRAALNALAALHRRRGERPELLDVLGRLAVAERDPAARQRLQIERARAAAQTGAVDEAISAFTDALRADPRSPEAPAAALDLVELCRREGRWEALADALGPQGGDRERIELPPAALAGLAAAYEHLGRWKDLAAVREREVFALEQRGDLLGLAAAARALAALYERAGDLDGAARAWHRVDEVDEVDLSAARALQRIYAERGRHADLAGAIERELLRLGAMYERPGALNLRSTGELGRAADPPSDVPRALELWLRLGAIRRERLGRPDSAAEAYEAALRLDPKSAEALAALVELYGPLGRTADLLRALEQKARAEADPKERVPLLLQIGEQKDKLGDAAGALSALRDAFFADPTNRNAFTAYERACYRRERWADVMALYNRAITLVETEKQRAYRLADLYARRGQVELSYLGDIAAATASYTRLLELDPDSDAAQTALERIFSSRADWARLIDSYEQREKRLKDDTRRADVLRRAARVAAAQLHDAARAMALYQRLHAADPTDGEALDALERHYEETHDHARLLDVLRTRTALTTGGDEAIALFLRIAAVCEEGLTDIDQAVEAYKKILDIAPSHREALDALARLYEGTERWTELVDVSRRQIRIINDRQQKALIYFRCGSVMESKFGKDDDAIRYYDAAIKTSATCLPAVHGLRDLYLRREDWPRVIQTLELEAKLWSEEKERAGVLAHIGQLYRDKQRDPERAIQYFENALTTDRECLPANRALFELYFARGDWQRALPLGAVLTQKVMREGEPAERAEFYRKRGVVARETGDFRGAAESFVVGLEIRPESIDGLEPLVALSRSHPASYDFAGTFAQLARLYRKRDANESPAPGTLAARLLARVLVGQAALREREYDVEGAEQTLAEAQRLAPDDFPVLDAYIELQLRLRRNDAAALTIEDWLERSTDKLARRAARLRLASIYGDIVMAPERAVRVLQALLQEEPNLPEAHYRLAQEQFLLGRFPDAQRTCERLIEIAAAPGQTAPPEDLARYYDYLGRVAEAQGDGGSAARSYRRAVDLDPTYPPPILALARRFAAGGEVAQATALLADAIASQPDQPAAEGAPATPRPGTVELSRGLARLHVSYGDRREAIKLLHRLVRHPAAGAFALEDDRVLLAELQLLEGDLDGARDQLREVLANNVRCAPAYRVFMRVYEKGGHIERSARVAGILRLLGFSDFGESTLRNFVAQARRGTLSDELRMGRLVPPEARGVWGDVWEVLHEPLENHFPAPQPAEVPAGRDLAFAAAVADVKRLFAVEADVRLAKNVPEGVLAVPGARPIVYLEAALAERSDAERRFLLGRAFESLRDGTALLFHLRRNELAEVARLGAELLRPPAERDPQAEALFQTIPRRVQRIAERLPGTRPDRPFEVWLDAVGRAADRAGLLACDDVGAAVRILARLGGEELAVTAEGAVLLGQVPGAEELVRFFLSDAYEDIRAALEAAAR